MRITLLLTILTFTPLVGAQKLGPLSVDQTSSASGLLIYQGRSYVSLDLLKRAGATSTGKTVFLYTQPQPAGPPLKLSGCLNQRLYNNAFYLTVNAPQLQAGKPDQGADWLFPIVIQPVKGLVLGNSEATLTTPDLDLKDAVLTYKDGTKFVQRTMPIGRAEVLDHLSVFTGRVIQSETLLFHRDENEVEVNPPVKLVLPPTKIYGQIFPNMTIDLTCSK